MRAIAPARLWLLLGLLLSVTLGLYQVAHRSTLHFGLDAGESLHDRVTVLRDPGGRMGVEDVAAAARQGAFLRPDQPDLMYGYTRDVIWIRFSLASDGERYLDVSPPRLADVRLYVRGTDGRFRERRSGLAVPVAEREVRVRQAVFALQPDTDLRETYARIASQNAILVDLRLWEPLRFLETARHIDLLNGLQFGALLLFAIYAFATAAALRESTYAWFGLTLLAYAFYDISILQYGYQYLWPSGNDWALRSAGVFLAIWVFGLGQLVAGLLQARLYFPAWNRVLRGLGLVALAYIPGMAAGNYPDWVQWLNYVALLQLLFTISVTLQAIFRGQQGAALLLAAFLLLWFTSLLRMGQILGVLPHTLLADYSQGWSMVVGGLLMAMTQAERLRRAHAEQELSRQALVEAQTSARENAERAVEERTRELLVAKDAAEASSRGKSAFLAQLSHELRTPLHSILGYSGLMRGDATDPEAQRRLDAIRRSGNHLLALIDSLLDYARGEAGRLQLELQTVRLRPFLDSIAEETRAFVDAAGMTLDVVCAGDLPEALRLDATRLRQVLSNLVVNASRHSQGRHIVLEVKTETLAGGGCGLLLAVRDDGVGIAAADRERIFQPFEQGGEGAAGKGMGLGLAISQQLVALMGGELVLEPQSPGCRFCVRLAAERVELAAEAATVGEQGAGRPAGAPRRVLVVDGDADSRAVLVEQLGRQGLLVESAGDGATALARLQKGATVDLVLTDEHLPDQSGRGLLAAARAQGVVSPFVLVSAAPPQAGGGEGFVAVLLKPVTGDRLASVIGRVLGLAWRLEPAPSATPTVAAVFSPPSRERLVELRQAADEGRISDIEDWVAAVQASDPVATAFASAVLAALRRLDLAAIRRMTD